MSDERAYFEALEELAALRASHARLLGMLKDALRYIEVCKAYEGAMTAEQVESAIIRNRDISYTEIGANSCNTLAYFDFALARAAITQAEAIK